MKYPNGCGQTNGETPNNHEKVKKMSIEYMKTTKKTKAGTYRMWRSRGCVIVCLEPKIGGEDLVGWKHTVGTMTPDGDGTWYAHKVHFHRTNKDGAWERKAEDGEFCAPSTPSALKEFVRLYDEFFTNTLLEYEGEVFNPITNETRVHFINVLNEPLEETWVRISDDEEALARIWNNEFKKLAGAILPVSAWKCNDHHARPQRNVWASFDIVETKAYGMTSGVILPPRLWTIIDPLEMLLTTLAESKKQPFEVGKTYTNWPHRNATCKVIAVSDEEIRVEVKNSNGNIVQRWAEVKERTHMDTVCIVVDVEPFYTPCFNACDIVEVVA